MQSHLKIISLHQLAEIKRKELAGEELIAQTLLTPKDWGYNLDSELIPPSANLPR